LVLGAPQTLTINPQLFRNLPFDPVQAFAPIVVVASVPNVLVVTNKLPVKSAQELVSYAKARPGKLNYGSSSIGGTPHLSSELFKSMTDTFIVHVPYRGSAPALQDLIGGQIDMMFDNLPAALPQIRAGTIRALAVTTLKRSPAMPDLPTLDESGVKGFDSQGWFALLAPAGTPQAVLDRINAEVNNALTSKAFRDRLEKAGAEPVGGSIDDFKKRIASETVRWAKVIKFANIQAE
jgi:tripartite-type tricarboxylate transporter receptor subunit TctC